MQNETEIACAKLTQIENKFNKIIQSFRNNLNQLDMISREREEKAKKEEEILDHCLNSISSFGYNYIPSKFSFMYC